MSVDLHLHTTASDGHCSPAELVDRVVAAGVAVMAVADHDTTAAVTDAQRLAQARGIESVSAIEITAVEDGRDVHVLGYFIDPDHPVLAEFLREQREQRLARVEAVGQRLAQLGVPVDLSAAITRARTQSGWSIGRPEIARALIAAGHVNAIQEAFDRWLAVGRPAFVPRRGASAEVVFGVIRAAGGLASLAHPGPTNLDRHIPGWRDVGLSALEAYHPEHDHHATARYRQLAARLDLLLTGGSDFHGDPVSEHSPGSVTLPADEWHRFRDAAPRG